MRKISLLFSVLLFNVMIEFSMVLAATPYLIKAPAGASVSVGRKLVHFRRFETIQPDSAVLKDEVMNHYFSLTASQVYNFRVSQASKLTCAGTFTMTTSLAPLTITPELLEGDPRLIDRNLNANNNYNVADLYLNINETGHLRLKQGDKYQLVNIRAWQAVDNIINNYFIEPDYRYEVINETGELATDVVTVSNDGLLTAVGSGTAIVKVGYDALNVKTAAGGPFFGALWPENTGVFVVTVGNNEAGVVTGMKLNEAANAATLSSRLAGEAPDAELDVLYYTETEEAFNYRFTPEAGAVVTLARPIISGHTINFTGFSSNGVIVHEDGSYTVQLVNGRNLVRIAKAEAVSYQVLRARPVSYTLTNISNPGADLHPGDAVAIRFNSLFHPAHKLAGVYNMSARIAYKANGISLTGAANQYTFASTEKAQTITTTIPANWDPLQPYVLTNGAILASGYGDPYGAHRNISPETGKDVNFNAALRTAYFGSLPDVTIPVRPALTNSSDNQVVTRFQAYPNPFTDYLLVHSNNARSVQIHSLSGQLLIDTPLNEGSNRIDVSALPRGAYVISCGGESKRMVK
jgi:hypothetical protein